MKKYNRLLSLSLLGVSPFLFQGTALAGTTDFTPDSPLISQYIKTPSYITSGAKPLVMILFDTSGSMTFDAYSGSWDESSDDGNYGYFDPDLKYKLYGNTYKVDDTGLSGRYRNWQNMRRIDISRKVLTGGNVVSTTTDSDGKILTSTLQAYNGKKVIVDGEVSGVIQSSSDDVRFGLTTFDQSYNGKGGTVDQPVGGSIDEIVKTINTFNPSYGTPLAESLWTIIGYFQQSFDDHYESSPGHKYQQYGSYKVNNSWDPFYNSDENTKIDCAPAYVITMTDGLPSVDNYIPSWLQNSSLNKGVQIEEMQDDGYSWIDIYYDDVSWYAHNTDLRPDIDGEQNLDIYNIFTFGTERGMELMNASSSNGGTENAYLASSGEAISEAMAAILGDIAANSTTESSVSVIQGSRDGTGATYQASYFPEKESVDGTESVTWVGDVQALFIDSQSNFRENTVDTPNTNQLDPTEDLIYTTESTGSTVVAKLYHDYNGDGVLDEELKEADEGEDFDGDGYMTSTIDETEFITKSIEDVKYLWSAADWLNSSTLDPTSQRSYSGTDSKRFITTWIDSDNDGVIDEDERKNFTTGDLGKDTIYGYFLGSNIIDPDLNGDGNVDLTDLNNLINYIRGQDFDGMRNRTIDGTTYRLGDIIESTPTAVQTPSDNYDTRFNSTTYREFKQAYADRRTMVYAGGNDGLFHAFNGGFFQSSYTPDGETTPITNKFWLHSETSGDTVTYDDDEGLPLGAEMWAYAPYNLLPHLQWLTGDDYQHIYYNNLKPKVFAVRLWEEKDSDTVHVGGWGTLLIGGMKWGGGPITTDVNAGTSEDADNRTMRSAYFVFDITDPEKEPVLLSEFTLDSDDRFSFANVYPSVVPVKSDITSTDDPDSWFLALGNGPSGLKGESDQEGALIVRKFKTNLTMGQGLSKTGDLWEGIGTPTTTTTTIAGITETTTTKAPEVYFLTGEDNSFISNPYTPDLQQGTTEGAFSADTTYFGTIAGGFTSDDENDPGTWTGKMHRVVIQEATTPSDPNTWTESVFYNPGAPISTSPIVSEDDQGNYWVFFGTGRFYDQQDKKSVAAQAFYGLKEPTSGTVSPYYSGTAGTNILDVSGATVYVGDSADESAVTGLGESIENFSDLESAMDSTYDGWKVVFDAASGERNNTDSLLVSGIIVFNSYSPAYNICDTGGTSHVYTRYYKTGTAYWAGSVGVDEDTTTTYLGVTLYKALDTFEVSGFLPKLTYVAGDASQSEDERSTTGALIGISNTPELINLDLTPALDSASGKISWEQDNDD
jgi:type IV pilus assembly protein PilY1